MTRDEAYWHSLVHELVSLPADDKFEVLSMGSSVS